LNTNLTINNEKHIQPTANIKIILVIDTNIFLSNLDQLISLIEQYKNDILVSIPWVVLQELDYLKSTNKHSPMNKLSMSNRARIAIQFISQILSSNSNNFIFENSIQVILFIKVSLN
jgi:predicted ribonuclease YlaK